MMLPCCAASVAASFSLILVLASLALGAPAPGHRNFHPEHLNGVNVADFSNVPKNAPKFQVGGRVVDLMHGLHFDDIQIDTPNGMRPAAAVLFHRSDDAACSRKVRALDFEGKMEGKHTPTRVRLFAAKYDMDLASKRTWYKFTPEMDLAARWGVTQCPEVVFVPRVGDCDGHTTWCTYDTDKEIYPVGCKDFEDKCAAHVKKFSSTTAGNPSKFLPWLTHLLKESGEPEISPFFSTFHEQERWIKSRTSITGTTHERNVYLSPAFPAFTSFGIKALKTPEPFQKWLLDFYKSHQHVKKTEHWDASSTQLNFHQAKTDFVDLDLVYAKKQQMANKYIKPLLLEWTGLDDLELTSFYGIRDYPEGAYLRDHIDRVDTHVISVTLSIDKLNTSEDDKPWPLEGMTFDGVLHRYNHEPGTMIFYESAKVLHGRPYKNEHGTHVSAFLHYKPKHLTSESADNWEKVVRLARNNVNRNVKHVSYRDAATLVEPESPVFTKQKFGDASKWRHDSGKKSGRASNKADDFYGEDDYDDEDDAQGSNGMFTVTFENKSGKRMNVYWKGHTGESVHQGEAAPGTSFAIQTYEGHKFFWADAQDAASKPIQTFTCSKGVRTYTFRGDGTNPEKSGGYLSYLKSFL